MIWRSPEESERVVHVRVVGFDRDVVEPNQAKQSKGRGRGEEGSAVRSEERHASRRRRRWKEETNSPRDESLGVPLRVDGGFDDEGVGGHQSDRSS